MINANTESTDRWPFPPPDNAQSSVREAVPVADARVPYRFPEDLYSHTVSQSHCSQTPGLLLIPEEHTNEHKSLTLATPQVVTQPTDQILRFLAPASYPPPVCFKETLPLFPDYIIWILNGETHMLFCQRQRLPLPTHICSQN